MEDDGRRIHDGDLVLDIGGSVGALIIYTGHELSGSEIEVSAENHDSPRIHTVVHERRIGDRTVYAGVFAALPAREYRIWIDDPRLPTTVTIVGGEVAVVDWRPASEGRGG